MPPNTAKVARPTKWGNPYTVERWGREGAIRKYRLWLELKLSCGLDLSPLRGKNLACFCPLGQACHADVLLEFANAPTGRSVRTAVRRKRGMITGVRHG